MHCPQCGQQQVPGEVRFCSRCGFPLDGVSELVAHGGVLPQYEPPTEEQISPRRKGVKQGVMLLMLGIVITSLLGIFNTYLGTPELFVALSAIIFFVGGPLRLLYALIFEEGAKKHYIYLQPGVPAPPLVAPPRQMALPPQRQQPPMPSFRPHPHTAEMIQPPSITENTTRLLEKEADPPER